MRGKDKYAYYRALNNPNSINSLYLEYTIYFDNLSYNPYTLVNWYNPRYLKTNKGKIEVYTAKQFAKFLDRTPSALCMWKKLRGFPDTFLENGCNKFYLVEHLVRTKVLMSFLKIGREATPIFFPLSKLLFEDIKQKFLSIYIIDGGFYC